jgi:hypothetical protein
MSGLIDASQRLYGLYVSDTGTAQDLAGLAGEVASGLHLEPGTGAQDLLLSPAEAEAGWRVVYFAGGAGALNEELSAVLDRDERRPIEASPFELSPALSRHAGAVLALRLGGRHAVNGPVSSIVRFANGERGSRAIVRRGGYIDGLVTNGLGTNRLYRDDELLVDGANLWLDRDGDVAGLMGSLAVNQYGGSIIALTSDDHVVMTVRSQDVIFAPGLIDLTASGGFHPPAEFTTSLGEFSQHEVLRELREEVQGSSDGPLRTLATFRNLSRGGQPDVLFVGRLRERFEDLVTNDEVAQVTSVGQASSFEQFAAAVANALALGPPSANLQVLAALVARPDRYPVATRAVLGLFT